uniref:Uncharacterized protein n=1 Tax=Acrobeloides nanus TaxID=290746 RepID=A0A914CJ98_9BILA
MNNSLEEIREMNLQDLYTKLQLTDNEFDDSLIAWDYLMNHKLVITAIIKCLLMREIVDGSVTSAVVGRITQKAYERTICWYLL